MEVKSAMLRTWHDEKGVLTLVDEHYEIHSISGSVEVMRLLLQDVELPNFKWVHSSDGRAYYAEGHEYKGRYDGSFSLKVLDQYRKEKASA
jgi:hypothetical protein